MQRITIATLAGIAVLYAGTACAQAPDFSKVEVEVEIKTTDLGNKTCMHKAEQQQYHDTLVSVRDRVKKLYDAGKSEQEVLAADPLSDLNAKWSAAQGLGTAVTLTRNVYNSLCNHN